MALPQPLRVGSTPSELELIASQHPIDIVPFIAMERTAFISGAYGPLRPPHQAQVPLWMAVNLKQKKKCRIVGPAWLTVEFLQDRLADETTLPDFSPMPFRFAEISKVLLDVASDDLASPDKLRGLLKDIREARQAKAREKIGKLDPNATELKGLCAMEVNELRPFMVQASWVAAQLDKGFNEGRVA